MIRTRAQRRREKLLQQATEKKEEMDSDYESENEIDALAAKFDEQINIESPKSQKVRRSKRLREKERVLGSDIDSENDSCASNRSPPKSESDHKSDSTPQTPKKRRRTQLRTPPRYASLSPQKLEKKPSPSPISNQKSESQLRCVENTDEKQLETTAINVVFPPLHTITYKNIVDYFTIDIPSYAEQWVIALFELMTDSDYATETTQFEWLALLNPSLQLIIAHCDNPDIVTAAQKTISAFHAFIHRSIKIDAMDSVNDICTCLELLGPKLLPESLWTKMNARFEEFTTFNTFVYWANRPKEKTLVCNFPKFKVTSFKSQHASVKKAWGPCVGMYTTVVRLHRLFTMYPHKLTPLAKEKLNMIFDQFSKMYLPLIPQFLNPLITLSDGFKMDYPYGRYKILCMCTHTNTSIVPTFAAEFGIIDPLKTKQSDAKPSPAKDKKKTIKLRRRRRRGPPPSPDKHECKTESTIDESPKKPELPLALDLQSWESTFKALAANVIQFVTAIDALFGLPKSDFSFLTLFESDEIKAMKPKLEFKKRQSISKMKKSDSKHFRALDNIAYVSTCLLIMTHSWPTDKNGNEIKYNPLKQQLSALRQLVVSKMGTLAKESHLFVKNYTGYDMRRELLMRDYLTYATEQPQVWELHLIAGIFLCFWNNKER